MLVVAACQKEDPQAPKKEPLDYSIQVIPNIQEIFSDHVDLINAMDTLLHFGDNPPQLSKLIVDTSDQHLDTLLGFCGNNLLLKSHIKSDPNSTFPAPNPIFSTYQFLVEDQHKGIASMHFRSAKHDSGPDNHYIETATCRDSVFIMGEKPFFTAYYFQDLNIDNVNNGYTFTDPKPKQAFILTGEVTDNGIKDLYIGFKIYHYEDSSNAGIGGFNIGDIVVYYKDFLPFTYWYPNQTYNN